MTRKRFIKLQMARGVSRNEAATLAQRTRAVGRSYADAAKALSSWDALTPVLGSVCDAFALLSRALRAGAEAFQRTMEGGCEDGSQHDC